MESANVRVTREIIDISDEPDIEIINIADNDDKDVEIIDIADEDESGGEHPLSSDSDIADEDDEFGGEYPTSSDSNIADEGVNGDGEDPLSSDSDIADEDVEEEEINIAAGDEMNNEDVEEEEVDIAAGGDMNNEDVESDGEDDESDGEHPLSEDSDYDSDDSNYLNIEHNDKIVSPAELRALTANTRMCAIHSYYSNGHVVKICARCMHRVANAANFGEMCAVQRHYTGRLLFINGHLCEVCGIPMYVIMPCDVCAVCMHSGNRVLAIPQ